MIEPSLEDQFAAVSALDIVKYRVTGMHEAAESCWGYIVTAGPAYLYASCATWAYMGSGLHRYGGDGEIVVASGATLAIVHGPTGRLVEPEDAPPQMRPHLWAGRFINAIAVADNDTANALFETAWRAAGDGEDWGSHAFMSLLDLACAAVASQIKDEMG